MDDRFSCRGIIPATLKKQDKVLACLKRIYKDTGMSNLPTSDLTGFASSGLAPETLAHLERDRWPEFERELLGRRPRKTRFLLSAWGGQRPRWAWMIWRCRKWEEVERVLNRHRVEYRWKERRSVLELEWLEAEICRLP